VTKMLKYFFKHSSGFMYCNLPRTFRIDDVILFYENPKKRASDNDFIMPGKGPTRLGTSVEYGYVVACEYAHDRWFRERQEDRT
jgi:hypothetical protein